VAFPLVPCRECGRTPTGEGKDICYARCFCRDCFLKKQRAGLDAKITLGPDGKRECKRRKKEVEKEISGSVGLYYQMRDVLNEAPGAVDTDPAKNTLRKLRDENPTKFLDQMGKLEPKITTDGGPKVVVITLPAKVQVGAYCEPPAAATTDAVERLVMDLEDRKGV
jgi:hypothetical protein